MKKLLSILILLYSLNTLAQGEAANWYFGFNAAIQFNQGGITVLNDNALSTNEGSATISDPGGNLLFYTDGENVFNRNHQIMANGNGLLGNPSSSQSAIIVPKPNDINIYYIFTVDDVTSGSSRGLHYSEVDIRLDGGLGAVTQKNINLLRRTTEKVSAVLRDCFDGSLWVVTFASQDGNGSVADTFHAFQVNDTGVSMTPVSSTFNININDGRGYLKLSPDGTKLASANADDGLYIYDFDALSGVVSNQQQLVINNQSNSVYGIEFSPNSQVLYVHSSFSRGIGINSSDPNNHTSALTQFDLTAANIQASEVLLDDRILFRGALQLGIDGRIYRALSSTFNIGTSFLGVINNPNTLGVGANYQHDAINLSPNTSSQGLPPFDQSLFVNRIDIIRNGISAVRLDLCVGETYTLMGDNIPGATYTWSRDGVILTNETNFDLFINQGGFYELLIDPNNGDCPIIGEALVTIFPEPDAFDTTLIQCDEDGIAGGFNTFDLSLAINDITGGVANRTVQFYPTLLDAQNETNEITNTIINTNDLTQVFFARVSITSASVACFSIAELRLDVTFTMGNDASLTECDNDGTVDGRFTFNLQDANPDISTDPGLTFTYYLTNNDAILAQNPPLPNLYTNTTPFNQIIYVRSENNQGCFSINEVELIVTLPNDTQTTEEVTYCEFLFPQTITLTSAVPNDQINDFVYLWSTGETTPEIEVNGAGVFTVVATNFQTCTTSTKITTVTVANLTTITDPIQIDITDASESNIITVVVSGSGNYEYALNNINGPYQSSNRFENVPPGLHTVYIRDLNNCSIAERSISVIGFLKFFTPNNDSTFDTWQVIGISRDFQPNTTIFIFDRYGKLLKQLDPLGPGWNGTFNGQLLPASDYWYRVTLEDGRVFRGHFALVR